MLMQINSPMTSGLMQIKLLLFDYTGTETDLGVGGLSRSLDPSVYCACCDAGTGEQDNGW